MCPPAATCGKSDRARIGTWKQIGQFLHGAINNFAISINQKYLQSSIYRELKLIITQVGIDIFIFGSALKKSSFNFTELLRCP